MLAHVLRTFCTKIALSLIFEDPLVYVAVDVVFTIHFKFLNGCVVWKIWSFSSKHYVSLTVPLY